MRQTAEQTGGASATRGVKDVAVGRGFTSDSDNGILYFPGAGFELTGRLPSGPEVKKEGRLNDGRRGGLPGGEGKFEEGY